MLKQKEGPGQIRVRPWEHSEWRERGGGAWLRELKVWLVVCRFSGESVELGRCRQVILGIACTGQNSVIRG